jgi:hypothetical protein
MSGEYTAKPTGSEPRAAFAMLRPIARQTQQAPPFSARLEPLQVDFDLGLMHDRNCHSQAAPAAGSRAIVLIDQKGDSVSWLLSAG